MEGLGAARSSERAIHEAVYGGGVGMTREISGADWMRMYRRLTKSLRRGCGGVPLRVMSIETKPTVRTAATRAEMELRMREVELVAAWTAKASYADA